MQSLTQPTLLLKPFAESGDKNSIPVTNTDAQNPQLADLTNGFPSITSDDPDDGGLPPERKDINGLGYLTTTYDYFYQAGGTFTFNPTISTAIGGYPLGARLWYTDSNGATTVVRSTVANNTDNFNDGSATGIGTTWVPEIPALGWNNTWTGSNTYTGVNNFVGYLNKTIPNYTLGQTPSSNINGNFGVYDENGTWLGGWEHQIGTDGSIVKRIAVFRKDGNEIAGFDIGYNSSNAQYADATAGVKSSIVSWGMPKYSSYVSVSNTGSYTAVSNGYIFMTITGGAAETHAYINGVDVSIGWWTNTGVGQRTCIPMNKGDTITWDTGRMSGAVFVPCIGG